jgi:hypothetical protein
MLEAVLGRLDNLSEWENLLDEWRFADDEEVPFPLSQQRRQKIRAVAQEVALVRAHHILRRHFKGDLMELRTTLRSLADLVLEVEQHEVLAQLDEDEQMRQIEAMRADIAKGDRIAQANEDFFQASLAETERRQERRSKKGS